LCCDHFYFTDRRICYNYNGEEWKIYLPEKLHGVPSAFFCSHSGFPGWFVARLMKADSAMGKQLDSLADVVSFGVAPGLIMYQLLRIAYAYEPGGLEIPIG
jgi:CDP-diacylglycerol--serine O-phosphatidyltransferase